MYRRRHGLLALLISGLEVRRVTRMLRRRRLALASGVVIGTLALAAGSAAEPRFDPPGHGQANHCIIATGVDVNAQFAVSDQLIFRGCETVTAGEHWRPNGFNTTASSYDVRPPGYEPSAATPQQDFLSKLTAVKVIVDAGTAQERISTFAPSATLFLGHTLDALFPGAPPFPIATTLPRMKPLPIGEHTFNLVWVLSAEHCDGLTDVRAQGCIPAGENIFPARTLTVMTP
jgi:hypothetical protein